MCFSVIWSTLWTRVWQPPTPSLHRSDRSLLRGGNTFLPPVLRVFSGGSDPGETRLEHKPTSTNGPMVFLVVQNWWLTAFYPTNPWWKEWSNWEYLYSKPIKHHNQETVANQNNSSKSPSEQNLRTYKCIIYLGLFWPPVASLSTCLYVIHLKNYASTNPLPQMVIMVVNQW